MNKPVYIVSFTYQRAKAYAQKNEFRSWIFVDSVEKIAGIINSTIIFLVGSNYTRNYDSILDYCSYLVTNSGVEVKFIDE